MYFSKRLKGLKEKTNWDAINPLKNPNTKGVNYATLRANELKGEIKATKNHWRKAFLKQELKQQKTDAANPLFYPDSTVRAKTFKEFYNNK